MADTGAKSGLSFLRTILIISIAMILVVIAAAATYLAFQDDTQTDFIVLKADNSPIRIAPDKKGGKEIDHQDSAVLQMLDDIKLPEEGVDRLILPDANPELPPVPVPSDEIDLAEETAPIGLVSETELAVDVSVSQNATEVGSATQAETDTVPEEAANTQKAKTNEDLAGIIDQAASESEVSVLTPTSRPKTDDTEKASNEPKIIEAPKEFDEDNPPLMVQLAAFRDQAKAVEAAALLSEKHRLRLLSLQLGVMAVDTGSSGIFWRVITEPLPAVDARGICDTLKSSGQDCILRPILLGGL